MGSALSAFALALSLLLVQPRPGGAAALPTNQLRPDFWDTDGTIHALVATNGRVYLGGDFSYVAPKGRKVLALDTYTGASDTTFPALDGSSIHSIVADGQGGWFIGGQFHVVGNPARSNLVHILNDHSLDPEFHPDPDAAVRALALDGDTLYVGGEFTQIQGQLRSRLAAMDVPSRALTSWNPGANEFVAALRVGPGKVYVGGRFTQIGGQARDHIAALDAATGMAMAWNPDADGDVLSIDLTGNLVIVGGSFNLIGGQFRNGLAALDALMTTSNATSWNPDPAGGDVTVVRVDCNTVYVGGYFTSLGNQARARVGAVDLNSGLATSWNPGLGLEPGGQLALVRTIELGNDRIYLGGELASVGGQAQTDLATVDRVTGALLPWNPEVNGGVTTVAVQGRTALVGFLGSPGGVARQNLAALDGLTGRVLDWDPQANGPVYALASSGNTVFAGGTFTEVGGLGRARLAALDADSGAVQTGWNQGASNAVYALAVSGDNLYVGGTFTMVGGLTRQRLAAVRVDNGQVITTWNAPVSIGSAVYALAIQDNTLFVGGSFSILGGQFRNHLAAVQASNGGVITSWNPSASHAVRTLALLGNVLYAGGEFTSITIATQPVPYPRAHVAALDTTSGMPTAWTADTDFEVRALLASGATVFAGGTFTVCKGQPRFGLAAVDTGGTLLSWDPGLSSENRVFALAGQEQLLLAGGDSPSLYRGSQSGHALAAIPATGAPLLSQPLVSQHVDQNQSAYFLVQVSGQEPLTYQWRFEGVDLLNETNAALWITNAQPNQSGIYSVLVTNTLGAVAAQALLTVIQPVSITSQPVSQSVAPGSTIVLSVGAEGNPTPIYQWRINGVDIPGAVYATLTLTDVMPADGGQYDVIVANAAGAMESQPATIIVTSPALPFADEFNARGTLVGMSGTGSGSNVGATSEAGETNHVGKLGGASVWLTWTAPDNGIATFRTRGSTFDTLLAVYTGIEVATLSPVAADEDRAGFLTSQAAFNAVAGTEYVMAIDGLGAASGHIVLEWSLDTTVAPFPRITSHPLSLSVTQGAAAAFSVLASSPTPVTYQWFHGCDAIPDATNAALTLLSVKLSDVGSYRVFVMNDSSQIAESFAASLDVGPVRQVVARVKYQDLYLPLPDTGGGGGGSGGSISSLTGGGLISAFISVASGTIGFQVTDNRDAVSSGPLACGVRGGAAKWFGLQPTSDGVLLLDTMGSGIDTVLAIYTQANITAPLVLVTCDNNSAPDGLRSRTCFRAVRNTQYLIAIDGVDGTKGVLHLNWQLGGGPVILSEPSTVIAYQGYRITLIADVDLTAPCLAYQWWLDGAPVPGATNQMLVLNQPLPGLEGEYSLVITNLMGKTSNMVAHLNVATPVRLKCLKPASGLVQLRLVPPATEPFILQEASAPGLWVPIFTNPPGQPPLELLQLPLASGPPRFYRLVP